MPSIELMKYMIFHGTVNETLRHAGVRVGVTPVLSAEEMRELETAYRRGVNAVAFARRIMDRDAAANESVG